jgi:hypothetical protein
MLSAKEAASLTAKAKEAAEQERIQVRVPFTRARILEGIRNQASKGETWFIAETMYRENKDYLEGLGYEVDGTYVRWGD